MPILLLSFYFLNSNCLLINFLFRLSIYSNIVPFVDFDFSSSIILILLPRLVWHMWQQKCINTKTKSRAALWQDHYSRHYWILIMINIGVSFSIFLNLDDCQEYGQKEMFWIKCYTADLIVAQLWGPVQMPGQNNWCY